MPNLARVITWDGLFGRDSLPQISLAHTPALPGATFDWAADTLFPGGVASWADMVSGQRFTANGATPQLIEDSSGKYLSFDGKSARMQVSTPISEAHSVIVVYRFKAPDAYSVVHYGTSGSGVGWVGTGGSGATVNAGGSGSFLVPSPYIKPDTGWHVAILTVDGAESAFRHDDAEVAGSIAVGARDGLTLGFATGGTGRTAIDYRRVAIIPGGMDSARRAGITAYLRQRYGF